MIISKPNDDGVVFVTGKENKYLVIYDVEDEIFPEIETGRQIFNRMDMSDCYDISIKRIWLITDKPTVIDCRFRGTWHDGKDPLRMQIENLITGEIYDVGYGIDH